MATNWTFISAASDVTLSNTATVTATPTPNAGDLLVMSWVGVRGTTRFTGAGVTDNGSGGWQQINSLQGAGTFTAQQCWWKVASALDDNLGSAYAATITGTGGSGSTWTQYLECDVFRLPVGYAVVGLDLAAATVGLSSVTTFSLSPITGTSYSGTTDALAWTSMCSSLVSSNGGVTGSNTFTGTTSAANLAVAVTTNDTLLLNQYVGGVTASATPGTNVWKNTWTTSRGPIITGATFVYTADTPLSVPKYSVQVSMTDWRDTPDWIDITRWVRSGSVKRGRQHELQRAVAGTCALTMSNQDGRFSTFNANSPYINIMTGADSYFADIVAAESQVVPTTGSTWAARSNCTASLLGGFGFDGYPALFLTSTASGDMTASTATGTSGYAVTAGNAYGFQAQFVTGASSRSCFVGVGWYNSSGTLIGSVTYGSAVIDVVGIYAKATLTATAPVGAVTAALFIKVAGTAAGSEGHLAVRFEISNADQQGNVVTAWAPGGRGLVPTRPVRVLATSNLVTFPVYYGYVDSWVPAYTGPVLSDQVINCTDGLNLLALAYITKSAYADQILADGAEAYWRLGDTVPPTFDDSSGNNQPLLANAETLVTTGVAGALLTDTDAAVTLGTSQQGTYALSSAGTFTTTSGACTIECWVQTSGTPSQEYPLVTLLHSGSIFFQISLGSLIGASPFATYELQSNLGTTSTTLADGNYHHVVATVTSGAVATLYVDGVQVRTDSWAFVGVGFDTVEVGTNTTNTSATIDEVAVYPTALSAAQVAVHYALGVQGFIQQQSGQRIGAVLTALGVPTSVQNLATGISAVQAPAQSLTTTPVLTYVQTVENTEQGFFFVDEAGNFTFLDRHYILQNSAATLSNGTFANDANPTHYKYLENSIIPADDALDLWNDWPVSATANEAIGVTGAVQDAPNTDSQRWYGSRTQTGYSSMLQTSDAEALELSQWGVAHYGLPLPRVRQMKLDATVSNPSSIPQMLGRGLWDCITVQWQPMDGTTSPFIQASLIESIQHDFAPDTWVTTWGLSVAETQLYFVLNDPVRGTLAATGAQTGNRLGFGF